MTSTGRSRRNSWRQWEAAPAGGVPWPPGSWRHDDLAPLHGVWGRAVDRSNELVVVANHGYGLQAWHVPLHRWRFASELVRVSNCTLSQMSWVWQTDGRLAASDPGDTAVGLVIARHKPVGLADTEDDALAARWVDAAESAGLVVRVRPSVLDCGPEARTVWFLEVAVPATFGARFDLDLLLADYEACLPGDLFEDVEVTISELASHEIAEVLDEPELIIPCSAGALARTGLALGYHPATTAGLIMDLERSGGGAWTHETAIVEGVLLPLAELAPLPGLPSCLETAAAESPMHR